MDEAKRIDKVEKLLGYTFKNKQYIRLALIHSSARRKNEKGRKISNERLEFLGDAVLGFVITELLYRKYPDVDEGELTRFKSTLVSRRTLAIVIRELKLQNVLEVGTSVSSATRTLHLGKLLSKLHHRL